MKKTALLVLVLMMSLASQGQKLKIGLQNSFVLYGANSKSLTYTDPDSFYRARAGSLMPTWRSGINAQYTPIRALGLETGLLFDLMGYRFSQSAVGNTKAFNGNTFCFGIKIPLLAYFKLVSGSGGSFFLGGGFNFNIALSGSYRYRMDGLTTSYQVIPDFKENINTFATGYQVVLGLEDSEFSQLRLTYGANISEFTRGGNLTTPYYIALSFIYKIN